MKRIDYLDDPAAPPANSMVPSVNVVVTAGSAAILLIQRTDNGNWALPGGAIDLGESIEQAAVREVEEETGIRCRPTGVVGLYSNPGHVIEYTSNGEVRQEFSIVLTATAVGGQARTSDESSDVRWVTPAELPGYSMHASMEKRVEHYLAPQSSPYIG